MEARLLYRVTEVAVFLNVWQLADPQRLVAQADASRFLRKIYAGVAGGGWRPTIRR